MLHPAKITLLELERDTVVAGHYKPLVHRIAEQSRHKQESYMTMRSSRTTRKKKKINYLITMRATANSS